MKRTLISTHIALCILTAWLLTPLPGWAQQRESVTSVRAEQGWEVLSPTLRGNKILGSEMEVLDFRNTPLQDVVRLIAEKSGLNILFDPNILVGDVTLHLEKVRLGTALQEILKTRGLTLVVSSEENIVRVVRASMTGQVGVETVTEVVFLKYLDARRAAENLRELFKSQDAEKSRTGAGGAKVAVPSETVGAEPTYVTPERDQLSVEERLVAISFHRESNSLLLTAPPLIMAKMKEIISTLDKPGNEVAETKTQVVHINWLDAVTLATDLTNLFGKPQQENDDKSMDVRVRVRGVEESLVRIVPQAAANSIMVTAPSPYFEDVLAVIEELDVPQKQVQIQARLVDMKVSALRDLGTNFDLWKRDPSGNSPVSRTFQESTVTPGAPILGLDPLGGSRLLGFMPDTTAIGPVARAADGMGTNMPLTAAVQGLDLAFGENLTVFNNKYNLSFELRALEERRVVEVLANPRVMVVNKDKAEIKMVQKIPYITTTVPTGGVSEQQTVNFAEAGVTLTVTPTITESDHVRVALEIVQDIHVGNIFTNQGPVPIIDTRRTNTGVVVKTGETIMTGGLRQLNLLDTTSGVPWFHQIPVLGWLFKVKSNQQDKTELFLFVTPNVMENIMPTSEERGWYDRIDYKWNLPDYFFDDVKTLEDMD